MDQNTSDSALTASAAPRLDAGATATEYALLIAGITIVLAAGIVFFGDWLVDSWTALADVL